MLLGYVKVKNVFFIYCLRGSLYWKRSNFDFIFFLKCKIVYFFYLFLGLMVIKSIWGLLWII